MDSPRIAVIGVMPPNDCLPLTTNKPTTKNTMNTLQKIKAQRPWIEIIDDETDCSFGDNGFIVTLKKEYVFALDPDCSVRGFDTISELKSGTSKSAVRLK